MGKNQKREDLVLRCIEGNEVELSEVKEKYSEVRRKQTFKAYDQSSQLLFPPSLLDWIPEEHMVLVVNEFIDKLDRKPLEKLYKGGGASAYDPIMMLKVIIYAFICGIYTTRMIAKAIRENIYFRFLSGNQTPDFRTINIFISKRLPNVIDQVFADIVLILSIYGYIKNADYFVDGTIIKANAKKTSYVWRENVKKWKTKVLERVRELLKEIEKLQEAEDAKYGDKDLEEMGEDKRELSSEEIEDLIKMFNDDLRVAVEKEEERRKKAEVEIKEEKKGEGKVEKKEEKRRKRAEEKERRRIEKEQKRRESELNRIKKKLEKEMEKLRRYEEQEKKLNGRRSYSKTDEDATFMRLKNGELVPGYMVIMGTENQFILNISIHQKPSEADNFIEHMEGFLQNGFKPKRVIGDSAYGSLINYRYLDRRGIEGYLKYNNFRMEESNKSSKDRFHRNNFKYEANKDVFICPEGEELEYVRDEIREDKHYRIYTTEKCKECKFRNLCSKSPTGIRTIRLNIEYERYKREAYEKLTTEEGIKLRKRRNVDVESVFGQIKHNMKFRSFIRRGLEKVKTEMKLMGIALDIKKYATVVS